MSRLLLSALTSISKRLTALLFALLIQSLLLMTVTGFMPLLISQTPARIRRLRQVVAQIAENQGTA
ncbi:hypothetical protein D3C79_1094560 [compost metagenome]